MTDLVERYVYKVGSYLPESEREEVQNELRSLIQDQLDDRFKGAPTQDDVVELLKEFGDPRQMAASYGREQYLIGPDLYPTMMYVLQRGWVWVPIMTVSTMGGFTGRSDFHTTMKLAPDPPLLSFSGMTNRIDSRGLRTVGALRYTLRRLPCVS